MAFRSESGILFEMAPSSAACLRITPVSPSVRLPILTGCIFTNLPVKLVPPASSNNSFNLVAETLGFSLASQSNNLISFKIFISPTDLPPVTSRKFLSKSVTISARFLPPISLGTGILARLPIRSPPAI